MKRNLTPIETLTGNLKTFLAMVKNKHYEKKLPVQIYTDLTTILQTYQSETLPHWDAADQAEAEGNPAAVVKP